MDVHDTAIALSPKPTVAPYCGERSPGGGSGFARLAAGLTVGFGPRRGRSRSGAGATDKRRTVRRSYTTVLGHGHRHTLLKWVALSWGVVCALHAAPAAAIPVFARLYDKPCGACHTVFPQLNPEGENVRAHGLHGLVPAVKPLKIGTLTDVPGTVPLALYLAGGEDFSKVDVPAQRDPTRTHLNLDFLRLLAGGEVGRHLAFMVDYELIEMEPDTGNLDVNTLPYQAYVVAHAERWEWLGNLKAGWYELPFLPSPQIHRLSARPYLIYGLNACSLLDVAPPRGTCEDTPTLGETQIGLELNAVQPESGLSWAAGFTNGSNNRLDTTTSRDLYLHASQAMGPHRVGLFFYYSPDIVGGGVDDRTLRLGPDVDFYSRRLRLLGQFLASYESDPTGHSQALWYYGGFLEANYRLTPTLLSLLRVDYTWTPTFDDRMHGGETPVRRRVWEVTGGWQWLILQNVKLVAEATYGENHEAVRDGTVRTWAGTIRLVTAFWFLDPPGLHEWMEREPPT